MHAPFVGIRHQSDTVVAEVFATALTLAVGQVAGGGPTSVGLELIKLREVSPQKRDGCR